MDFTVLCCIYAAVVQIYGCYIYGIKALVYLTSWCSILHTFTLFYFAFNGKSSKLRDFLLITSWSLGWTVTILFWFFILPMIDPKLLPPVPQYVSTHGGINLLISYFFIKSNLQISLYQVSYPILICIVYFFGMITPLKFWGISVYPKFLDEVKATVIYVVGSIILVLLSFLCGYLLKGKTQKNKTN